MDIKIITGESGDVVVLKDKSRWTCEAWLNITERAVVAIRAAIDEQRITPAAQAGHSWMKLNGVTTREQFEDLEQHLPLLRKPMSAANGRRCRVCGNRIWGRESLLTGVGSECRRGRGKPVAQTAKAQRFIQSAVSA